MPKANFVGVLVFCAAVVAPGLAHAGELRFGAEPLAVNAAGKITEEGKKASLKEIPSAPGEEEWTVHVYAQIDKGGPGPVYLEFFGELPDGKPYLTYRHEYGGYNGEKYLSFEVELTGNLGFNKNKTYSAKLLQSSPKGKDIVFSSQKLTLVYTEPPPEDEKDDGGGDKETEGGDGDDPGEAQDEADTVAEGPPPIEPKKKGCNVHPEPTGVGLAILLLAAGFVGRRRRR
jgi:MYXO-CTERM domain-containing protein